MANTQTETMKLALEALESALSDDRPYIDKSKVAITALRQALEQQPADEPVAWVCYGISSDEKHCLDYEQSEIDAVPVGTMLYTRPQPAAFVGLSPEEIWEIAYDRDTANGPLTFARAIEAKLRSKNT